MDETLIKAAAGVTHAQCWAHYPKSIFIWSVA